MSNTLPEPLISALDSIGENTWRDDHIHRAFVVLDEMDANPQLAGNSVCPKSVAILMLDTKDSDRLGEDIERSLSMRLKTTLHFNGVFCQDFGASGFSCK